MGMKLFEERWEYWLNFVAREHKGTMCIKKYHRCMKLLRNCSHGYRVWYFFGILL